jgi:hypothetical protein
MKISKKSTSRRLGKFNIKVVIFSILALGFIALSFFVSPYFLIGAVVLMLINQRELMKKK